MKRIASLGFTIASCIALGIFAGAQTQPQSQTSSQAQAGDQNNLGDNARKARKDTTAKAKPKVYDNDNIPKDDALSVVGQPAQDTANPQVASGDNTEDAKKAQDDQSKKEAEWKEWQEKINAQKDQIDLLTRESDVLQKEYQLRAAAMYADVGNRLRNSAQWDKEDADYKQKIADKQKALDDAKQKLEDLQEEARKAGVPAAMREP
jgi:hypothetical protein